MPYTLNVERRGNYLAITVTGDNSLETKQAYLAEVRALCQKHQCPNVLIVENLAGPSLATFDIYQVASHGGAQALPVIGKMAYVDINPAHRLADMKFAEDVATNRGLNVRVFTTLQAAQEWMEQSAGSGDQAF